MEEHVISICTLISFLGIFLLFFVFYRDYRKDLFREKLFSIRDRLFLLGAKGEIDFDSNAYEVLRSIVNSSIRHGHRCGFFEIFFYLVLIKDRSYVKASSENFEKIWFSELEILPESTKAELIKLRGELHYVVVEQILFTSATVMCLVLPAILWLIMKRFDGLIYKTIRRLIRENIIASLGNAYDGVSISNSGHEAVA